MDARTPHSASSIAPGMAAGPLRPDRAGAAGRRGARRLPGRRLSGAARSGHRAGLGVRGVDRRDQFGDHRRQSAGAAARAAANLLGAHHRPQGLALHAGWRRLPQGPQPREHVHDDHAGPARLLQASRRQSVVQPRRRQDRDQLLRHQPVARDTARTGRLRSDQFAQGSFRGRRRQRAERKFPLLRQQERSDRPRTRDGERRAAAGAADGQDRHRPFLGRRHRFQHAAAASAGPGRQA